MLTENSYNVFINCPLDEDYQPIFAAILFCVRYLGFSPQVAAGRMDSSENRLEKIVNMIEKSKYSIHDLSRCRAAREGEYYRMNMPFELGIDYGCRQFHKGVRGKKLLVLEGEKYSCKAALSDLSGCDFEAHEEEPKTAVRKIRNWLVNEASAHGSMGAEGIYDEYLEFEEWNHQRMEDKKFSEEDIKDHPISETLKAIDSWMRR